MAHNKNEYKALHKSLLPKGKIWKVEEGSTFDELLEAKSEEFVRLEGRSEDLIDESDVRTTSELLKEHETDYRLPDECSDLAITIDERRRVLLSKLIAVGQQDKQYFIEVAAALGFTININEFESFICGLSRSGDRCGGYDVVFVWEVVVEGIGADIVYFTSGASESGDRLAELPGPELLQCVLNRLKPAHTSIIFSFDGPGFDAGFDNGFDSLPSSGFLSGGFDRGFDNGFEVFHGGGFETDGFSNGFERPT